MLWILSMYFLLLFSPGNAGLKGEFIAGGNRQVVFVENYKTVIMLNVKEELENLHYKTVSQELMVLIAEEGQSVNFSCTFMHRIEGLYLKRTFGDVTKVLYVTQRGKIKKENSAYENRTEYFEMNNTGTITLKHLKENDSDVYVCMAGMFINNDLVQKNSPPILLAVEAAAKKNFESPWMLYTIISLFILLLFMLGFNIIYHTNIKKSFQKGHAKTKPNFIYEDMTYSLRHKKSEPKTNQYAM